ncbi:MAG: rhamnulokinase [Clostridiales bacterium]|jgi:rhamnulokinase|nr:rhamnulokinase [Clostridiales bacterium]
MKYYLAIDIGASGGRHILGHLEDGKISCEEIYRFPNKMIKTDGELCWDLNALFSEILYGMERCAHIGKIPESVGIDTWGVDFVLLDDSGAVINNTVSYRDARTAGMDERVYRNISEDELYRRTGIQKQIFNTIFQLMALKQDSRQPLKKAKKMLLIPDYFHYLLTGVLKTEYTNATTTGLVNALSKTWDSEIIDACGFPVELFGEIAPPGTVLGCLAPGVQERVGYNCKVVLPATHDTASAVMAVPSIEEDAIYISSGTWSLMGVEQTLPDCSEESQKHNFTNEGGYDYRFRFLKNIMGLWMIQSIKKELNNLFSFSDLCEMAEKESITSIIDCNDNRFLSPDNMIGEIQQACFEKNQFIPKTPGEIAAVVYNSLSLCYRDAILELESINRKKYTAIYIVGGGANAEYLNKLTARYTHKKVYSGPVEATAIGNIIAQAITSGEFANLQKGRASVRSSFEIKCYT